MSSTTTPEDDSEGPDQTQPSWDPDGQTRCRCGAAVSSEVARVFGDNRDVVPVCAACYATRDGGQGFVSDSSALVTYFGGEGV